MLGKKPNSRCRLQIGNVLAVALAIFLGSSMGCSLWRGKTDDQSSESGIAKLMKVPSPPNLVREATAPRGMNVIQIDSVAAINNLPGTGGPADPSSYRDQLLEEMKRDDVAKPNLFLEGKDTSLCLTRGYIPPGARRGDRIDLQITTPPRSQVTDLQGGWLLSTRMRHQQLLKQSIRKSETMALGTGHVLTRASYQPGKDDNLKIEGRVLGGARVQSTRKLGLVLRPEYKHVKISAAIAEAINRRFFFFDGTTRRGIAEAIEDDFLEIDLHPRYKANVQRMMAVVTAIAVNPKSAQSQKRLEELSAKMREPSTAADAAMQLEGMGDCAIPTLIEHLKSTNPELRFYAAEALAYLDRTEAIEPMLESVRDVPAFRQPGLLALQGMPQQRVVDSLNKLLDEPSLETRYGTFVTIRRRADGPRTLGANAVGDAFRFYRIPSSAAPALVVSLREEPEIVAFGAVPTLQITKHLLGPGGIILKADPAQPSKIRISRFQPGKEDRRVVVGKSVTAIAQGIVAVGGGYGHVISILRDAKEQGLLNCQLAIDPLPKARRTYYRESEEDEAETELVN